MNYESIMALTKKEDAVILYFTTKNCNVCKSLKPKLKEVIAARYDKIKFVEIDAEEQPDIAAQLSVFAVPTMLLYFAGAEHYRKSRYINIKEFEDSISRPYHLLFE